MGQEEEHGAGQELHAKIAGQELDMKNLPVNMIFTILGVVGIGILIWQGIVHAQDSKETGAAFVMAVKEQTAAIKEQTRAQWEQNCLMRFPKAPDLCLQPRR